MKVTDNLLWHVKGLITGDWATMAQILKFFSNNNSKQYPRHHHHHQWQQQSQLSSTGALPPNVGDRVLPTSSVLGCRSSRSCPFPTQLCAKTVHLFNLTVSHEPLLPASFSVQIRCFKWFLLIMWTTKAAFCFFYSINQRPCWPRFFNYFSVFFGVHGILNILLQNQTSAASIFFCIGSFVVRALHPYTRRGSMNKILWTLCLVATDMFFFFNLFIQFSFLRIQSLPAQFLKLLLGDFAVFVMRVRNFKKSVVAFDKFHKNVAIIIHCTLKNKKKNPLILPQMQPCANIESYTHTKKKNRRGGDRSLDTNNTTWTEI